MAGDRANFPRGHAHESPLGRWFIAALGESAQEVLFFHGGWGKIAAAASTQYLIDHCRPRLIVNLGTCGGFHGAVERGAIILVERTVVYDIYEKMGDQAEHLAHYSSELELEWLQPPYPHEVVRTLIVSGDRDLAVDEIPQAARTTSAPRSAIGSRPPSPGLLVTTACVC